MYVCMYVCILILLLLHLYSLCKVHFFHWYNFSSIVNYFVCCVYCNVLKT